MSSKTRDHALLHTVLGGAAVLALGFGGAWFYLQHQAKLRGQTYFSEPVAVVTASRDHSVAATVSLRTTGAEAGWVRSNRSAVEQIVRHTLTETDLDAARGPDGLRALQQTLRTTLNQTLHTDHVQEVLITDFLVGDTSE